MQGSSLQRGQRMLPSSANAKGRTPLHEAARTGNAKILEKLAGRGHPYDTQDKEFKSPLHHAVMLEDGHDAPMALITAKAQLNVRDGTGLTPLSVAVCEGRFFYT
jgi:ankyrin repeat protein